MTQIISKEQKAYEEVRAFVESELGDYSFEWQLSQNRDYDEEFYFDLKYRMCSEFHYILFRYNVEEEKLYIELAEDNWEEIKNYSWEVKYFWMKVLWN